MHADDRMDYEAIAAAGPLSRGGVIGQPVLYPGLQVLAAKRLMIDITGLMMRAEAESKPRRRQNESPCGAPVARFAAWVGPYN